MVDRHSVVPTTTPEAELEAGASTLVDGELDRIAESLDVVRAILASGALEPESDNYHRLQARAERLAADLHSLLSQVAEAEPVQDAVDAEPETPEQEQHSHLLALPAPWLKLFDYDESPGVMSEFAVEALPQVETESITGLSPRGLSLLSFSLVEAHAKHGPRWRPTKTLYTARGYLGLFEPPKSHYELDYGLSLYPTLERIQRFTADLPAAEVEQLISDVKELTAAGQEEFVGENFDVSVMAPRAEYEQEQVPAEEIEITMPNITTPLEPEQKAVIDIIRVLMPPDGRMTEDEIIDIATERLSSDRETVQGYIHAAIHRLNNDPDHSGSFGREVVGSGYKARMMITMDPQLRLGNDEETEGLTARPTDGSIQSLLRFIRGLDGEADIPFEQRDPVEWSFEDGTLTIDGEDARLYPEEVDLLQAIKKLTRVRQVHMSALSEEMSGYRVSDEVFRHFAIWGNLVINHINRIAPVVVINNLGRESRRDRKTYYNFNRIGTWSALAVFTPGSVEDIRKRKRTGLHSYYRFIEGLSY